jgi:VWFA-related protein
MVRSTEEVKVTPLAAGWMATRTASWIVLWTSIWIFSATMLPMGPLSQASADQGATTLRVSTKFVLLDASIVSKSTGESISDTQSDSFQSDDFLLEEDGVAQRITYLSQDRLPLSVVFLFDLTDSVRPVLKQLAEGTRQILDHLKPEDEVAVLGFSSRTMLLQDFTTDHALAAAAVAKASAMKDEDGTFIHEDMYEAVCQALRATIPGSRRVLVWLTDGSSNVENRMSRNLIGKHAPVTLHTREEATDRLVRSGVVTSALIERSAAGDATIAFSYLIGARMGDVNRYADLTGGPVLRTAKPEVAARLAAMLDELRRRATLGYKPTVEKPPGTYCKLILQLSPAFFLRHPEIKRKDVVIRTKQGYYR